MINDSRERRLRRRAASLGWRVRHRNHVYELSSDDDLVLAGTLNTVEMYVGERYGRRNPGPQPWARPPKTWVPAIDDYLATLVAAGQTVATIKHRRHQLGQMARELGGAPAEVTGERLVAWLGTHTEWSIEHRRSNRSAARLFFLCVYKTGRIPVHVADELPKIRQPKAAVRPAPDHVWRQALAAADPRTTLILRLAGEAGLRRTEISELHFRDLTDSVDGAQLLVHGKGGKKRVIPISDSIAELIRSGAGQTPGASPTGWVFPNGSGEHLAPHYVAELAQRVLSDGWTLHTLRHRFATRAYRGSRNLRAVQTLLGHSSIATTERYLAVDDDEVRSAMLSAAPLDLFTVDREKGVDSGDAPECAVSASAAAPSEIALSSGEVAERIDDEVSQTYPISDSLGRGMKPPETSFESVISGWDRALGCEVSSLLTHRGDPCVRPAKWYADLHGCLRIFMCDPDLQTWKDRQIAGLRAGRVLGCVHCGHTFNRFEDACTITRL
jgi:integrase/recombinase XerC